MDGIDVALVRTDGEETVERGPELRLALVREHGPGAPARQQHEAERDQQPQLRLRTHLALQPAASAKSTLAAVELAAALGVDTTTIIAGDDAQRWQRFVEGLREHFPRLRIY